MYAVSRLREDNRVDHFMMAGLTCILVLFITICHGKFVSPPKTKVILTTLRLANGCWDLFTGLGETRVVNGPATRTDITLASTVSFTLVLFRSFLRLFCSH